MKVVLATALMADIEAFIKNVVCNTTAIVSTTQNTWTMTSSESFAAI